MTNQSQSWKRYLPMRNPSPRRIAIGRSVALCSASRIGAAIDAVLHVGILEECSWLDLGDVQVVHKPLAGRFAVGRLAAQPAAAPILHVRQLVAGRVVEERNLPRLRKLLVKRLHRQLGDGVRMGVQS
eukprot:6741145-Prymnesium_polylepis.2